MLISVSEIAQRAANPQGLHTKETSVPGDAATPLRADQFVEKLEKSPEILASLRAARSSGRQAIQQYVKNTVAASGSALLMGDRVEILLTLRSISDWGGMVRFCEWLDEKDKNERSFTSLVPIGHQYAMALNRVGRGQEAEAVLAKIAGTHGPDSETLGILGRVYKDRWIAGREHDPRNGFLTMALNAYWAGVECNFREVYPAVNTLTLLRIWGFDSGQLISFATHIESLLEARFESEKADYFDYASKIEVAVAMGRLGDARQAAQTAIKHVRAPWELETTANNLNLLLLASASDRLIIKEIVDLLASGKQESVRAASSSHA